MPLFVCHIISDEFQINGQGRFSIECRKTKAKTKMKSQRANERSKGNKQTAFRRENAGDQGMIGFSFVFWLVESWPITDRNKVNRPGGFIIYENNKRD